MSTWRRGDLREGRYGKPSIKCRDESDLKLLSGALDLGDGLDEVLIHRHEIRAVLVVDYHVGQADKKPLLFIDCVGNPVPHRRNEKIAYVDAICSADAYANLFPFGHGFLLPDNGTSLTFAT